MFEKKNKIERLKFDYKPNVEEKRERNSALMQANDLLKYRNIIIDAFKHDTFLPENLKKETKDAPNNFVLEEVSKFIQKIESISKNINLSLFNEFFEALSVDYVKYLINLKNTTKSKEFVTERKNRISNLKDRIKKNERKGKKKV